MAQVYPAVTGRRRREEAMKSLDTHLCFWGQMSGCAVGDCERGGPNLALRSLALEAAGAAEYVASPCLRKVG